MPTLASSIFVLALAGPAAAQALDPARPLTQYSLDAWTTESGLPHATVNTVLQARDGYLWVGTYDGLARFDGARFTVYQHGGTPEIGNNGIRALCEDPAGALWIGTNGGGLTRYQGGRFRHFGTAEGLPSEIVWSLHCDADGSVWVGTNGEGLARLQEGRFTRYEPARSGRVIYAMARDRAGTLWLGTQGDGLRGLAADGRWLARGEPGPLRGVPLTALAAAADGRLWVGTAGAGVVALDAQGLPVAQAGLDPLRSASVAALDVDAAGSLWIATNGAGLGRYAEGRLELLRSTQGLPSDIVFSLARDGQGSLWLGTNGGGLARLRVATFTSFTPEEGLSGAFAYAALEDRQGALWVGSAGGLDRLEGQRFVSVAVPATSPVRSLAESADGALWVGSYGAGVWRRAHGAWTVFTTADGLASDAVRAVLVDRGQRVWAATIAGLSMLEPGARRWRTWRSSEGLARDSLIALAEDTEGALWVGTDGGGLCRFRGSRFDVFTTESGLASNLVLALHVDRAGALWVGTNGGLSRYRAGRFTSFSSASGLPSDSVAQLTEDGLGQLWVGSSRGISRVPLASLEEVAAGRREKLELLTFDRADGMESSQCTAPGQPAGLRDARGRLWFGTTAGVVMVDPARLALDRAPPPVRVEEALVEGQVVPLQGELVLPPGRSRLEIRYAGLALRGVSHLAFRVRLEGLEEEWIEVGNRRRANYTALRPGPYRFLVSARNADGPWGEPAVLHLRMRPHFHETPLFLALVLSGLGAAVAAAHRLRVRSLVRRERDLVQLVAERTRSLAEAKERAEAAREQAERLLGAARAMGAHIELQGVLDAILAELQRVVPYGSASVQELQGDELVIVGGRGFPDLGRVLGLRFDTRADDNPNAQVVRRREPVILQDAALEFAGFATEAVPPGLRSWLGVPLLFGERLTGMLTLDQAQPGFYSAEHARVALAFAAQAAIALENARLHQTAWQELTERERAEGVLARQARHLASLHEAALAVMDRLDLGPLLETLVGRAAQTLGAPHGFLYLENREGGALECRVALGAAVRDLVVAPGEGAVGVVWATGAPVSVADYDAWPSRSPQVPPGVFGAMVAVPLRAGQRVQGALGLAHRAGSPDRFDGAEVALLAGLAQLASIALDNARLFAGARQARADAEKSEERFRQLAENIDAVFFMFAPGDPPRMLYVSPACERVFAVSREPLAADGRGLVAAAHAEERAALDGLFAPEPFTHEFRIARAQGEPSWVQVRTFPIRGPAGEVARVAGLAEDVTARRRLEELRADLAHTLVHDLKNPLASIMGTLELLAGKVPEADHLGQQMLQIAQGSSARLLRLVETLLDVSRLEENALPMERAATDLAVLAAEILEMERPLAERGRQHLVLEVEPGLPAAWADRALVGRVLQNLVGNAIKFSARPGEVRLRLRRAEGAVQATVADSGDGIPEDVRGRLFEKFAAGRQARRGTGLGLHFCRLAVEAHGGRIWAESARGGGARFSFTLPMAPPPGP